MPGPTTRDELEEGLRSRLTKLLDELDGALDADPNFADLECTPGWSVRELMAVRTWWTETTLQWIEAGKRGEVPETPAPGFTWKQTPQLNGEIIRLLEDVSIEELRKRIEGGAMRVLELAAGLDETELFEVGAFEWAGNWPISRWIAVNTTRQYETARTHLRKALKA